MKSSPKQNGLFETEHRIDSEFQADSTIVLAHADSHETLRKLPNGAIKLIISSPPYNIGKEYEVQQKLEHYLEWLEPILAELVRVLSPDGSLCWQVGNFVEESEVFPLDIYFYPIFKKLGLQLRNRIIWTFDHGLHCSVRFSGRYETLLWFTKTEDYTFNLDPVRVPSKYPGKRNFRPGPNHGKPSGNPLGKNPSDVWKLMANEWEVGLWNIPNVKANHPEKTLHPCQFPIELVERCVLALTNEGDWVLDPFTGVASALLAALKHDRKAMGVDREINYINEAKSRIGKLFSGELPYRTLGKPVHQPTGKEKVAQVPQEWLEKKEPHEIGSGYSFNHGTEVVSEKYPDLVVEINAAIKSIDATRHKTKKSKEKTMRGQMLFSPVSLNNAFKKQLIGKYKWNPVRVKCDYPTEFYVPDYKFKKANRGQFREMDFVKKKLGVEVQFGKYSFMVYNVAAKMTIFKNLGHIEAGVEIVPVKSFADEMSSGVSYFEQFVWDLKNRGVADIDIPVMILGIDADAP